MKGMTCSHCEGTVREALLACQRVEGDDVDRAHNRATIHGDSLDTQGLVAAVTAAGFDVVSE